MALDSLISGLFSMGESAITNGVNYAINERTNESNEKNVASTNAANISMTNSTNAANKQIAQDTNASNERIMRETNAFNAAQADLAYLRSTSSAKLGELISAGLSPEQARQVIASNGLTGSPSAASGTAIPAQGTTMQAPKSESFHKDPYYIQGGGLSNLGKGLGDFAQSFVDAAIDPSGGTLGQLTCMKQFAKASDIIDEVDPKALSSNYAFFQWMKNQPSDSNWGKLASDVGFKKMWNNPISRKAFMYNMNQWYGQAASTAFDLQQQEKTIKLTVAQTHSADLDSRLKNAQIFKVMSETSLIDEQKEGQNISNSRNAILLDRDRELKSLITETQKATFAKELADAKLQEELIKNPKYKDAYFSSTIGNLSAAAAEYAFVEWKYNKTKEAYNMVLDPDTEAVFLVLEDLGFAGTSTFEDMLKSVAKGSNLTTYLMGKGWKGVPSMLPDGPVDGYTAYKYSLEQWSKDMEQIRYDALRPFMKREDIRFGITQSANFIVDAVKASR